MRRLEHGMAMYNGPHQHCLARRCFRPPRHGAHRAMELHPSPVHGLHQTICFHIGRFDTEHHPVKSGISPGKPDIGLSHGNQRLARICRCSGTDVERFYEVVEAGSRYCRLQLCQIAEVVLWCRVRYPSGRIPNRRLG